MASGPLRRRRHTPSIGFSSRIRCVAELRSGMVGNECSTSVAAQKAGWKSGLLGSIAMSFHKREAEDHERVVCEYVRERQRQ
jgi:hypothetical protein